MRSPSKLLQILAILVVAIIPFSVNLPAQTIYWVAGNLLDETGLDNDQGFVDLLIDAGYDVERGNDTMTGNPLTTDQIDVLESFDLIIISRSTSSGSYNDPLGWNSITKPMILTSVYLSRNSRWQWVNTADLINNGRSGAPGISPAVADHPIFTGLTPDADGLIFPWDAAVGCGNTSLHNWTSVGDEGQILATTVSTDTTALPGAVAIAYWPADAVFYGEGTQFAGGPRLLLPCGIQEDGDCNHQGQYNLTIEGEILFLNAVAWMLGKDVGVAEKPATPSQFALAQNFPNPFNPSTTIKFSVPSTSNVNIRVFNVLGREVATLTNSVYQAGDYKVTWNGLDANGNSVESGLYLYKLETENSSLTKKMLLIK